MTKFPTPNQATTVNHLNIVSPAELQNTLQAKTAIALDDGTPRAFDIKALHTLTMDNEQRVFDLEQANHLHHLALSLLKEQMANTAPSGLQSRIIDLELQIASLIAENTLLANKIQRLETTQPKGYLYGQWLSDDRFKSPQELWPNSSWVEVELPNQSDNTKVWLCL